MLNVFVPATPNVTTGFLLFIPEEDVVPLDITVEEGIKLVVSGGIVVPPDPRPPLVPRPGAGPEGEEPLTARPRTLARLRHCVLAGLILTGPIGVTLWLVSTVVVFVDSRVAMLIPARWSELIDLPFAIPGLGVIVVLGALILVGMFATGYVGRALIRFGEGLVRRMPVIRGIYGAFKQIFETVLSQQASSSRQVVLFEYPRPRSWAMGFLTGRMQGLVKAGAEGESVNVFLPTTPNPTSGFLLFLPESKVEVLDMTVEEGIKMIVSGGLVTPKRRGSEEAEEGPGEPVMVGITSAAAGPAAYRGGSLRRFDPRDR